MEAVDPVSGLVLRFLAIHFNSFFLYSTMQELHTFAQQYFTYPKTKQVELGRQCLEKAYKEDAAACNHLCLLASSIMFYKGQTEEEQAHNHTIERNHIGFNSAHGSRVAGQLYPLLKAQLLDETPSMMQIRMYVKFYMQQQLVNGFLLDAFKLKQVEVEENDFSQRDTICKCMADFLIEQERLKEEREREKKLKNEERKRQRRLDRLARKQQRITHFVLEALDDDLNEEEEQLLFQLDEKMEVQEEEEEDPIEEFSDDEMDVDSPTQLVTPKCHCGAVAVHRISHSVKNPDRGYFNCLQGECNFFVWDSSCKKPSHLCNQCHNVMYLGITQKQGPNHNRPYAKCHRCNHFEWRKPVPKLNFSLIKNY